MVILALVVVNWINGCPTQVSDPCRRQGNAVGRWSVDHGARSTERDVSVKVIPDVYFQCDSSSRPMLGDRST